MKEVVASVMPVEKVRYFAFSHVEACECNSLNERLAVAPQAEPFCSIVAAMVSVQDPADQPPRTLADGEILLLGSHSLQWHDTSHLPDGWGCGFLSEQTTKTLLCGDLFIQGGIGDPPLIESDIFGPSHAFCQAMDDFSCTKNTAMLIKKLVSTNPTNFACMHGSAWSGDGALLPRELCKTLTE